MPQIPTPTPPEAYTGQIPHSQIQYRLERRRLGDLPAGSLFTRRPPHQFLEELSGVTGYDVVTLTPEAPADGQS
jgi:hypothetical protein